MEWISTKVKFPESGEQVLTACKNMNMEDGIWLYDLCYYYPNTGWENRVNWEDVLYWAYIDEPKLEVKDVDLEKEIKRFTMSKELFEADSVIKAVAEHFFELGIKAQKGE